MGLLAVSGQQSAVGNLTVSNSLLSYGTTSVFDLSAAESISVGANLILANTSINVLGSDLKLQPLGQGGVSILAGKVYIDVNGDLTVSGNAHFAKNLQVDGKILANIIAPLPGKDLVVDLGSTESGSTNNELGVSIHDS